MMNNWGLVTYTCCYRERVALYKSICRSDTDLTLVLSFSRNLLMPFSVLPFAFHPGFRENFWLIEQALDFYHHDRQFAFPLC